MLSPSYIQKISEFAKNKEMREMNSWKTASLKNEELKKDKVIDKNQKPDKICHM